MECVAIKLTESYRRRLMLADKRGQVIKVCRGRLTCVRIARPVIVRAKKHVSNGVLLQLTQVKEIKWQSKKMQKPLS